MSLESQILRHHPSQRYVLMISFEFYASSFLSITENVFLDEKEMFGFLGIYIHTQCKSQLKNCVGLQLKKKGNQKQKVHNSFLSGAILLQLDNFVLFLK